MSVTERTRSPIQWFGGKGMLVDKLLPLLPAHTLYVEVFGGGASLLFAKRPAEVEVYNDLDGGLVNLFRVLRDPEKFERFRAAVDLTLYSREEYRDCRATWVECTDDVERARRFYVVARQSFSGSFGSSWSFCSQPRNGPDRATGAWLSGLSQLPAIHNRLRAVQIEHSDFRVLFKNYDRPESLFYVDPPYVADTRKGGKYAHEMTDADHRDLVDILRGLKGRALLSGYATPLYAPLEADGWRRQDFAVSCSAAAKTKATGITGAGAATRMQGRTESVWISPGQDAQPALALG